MTVVGCNPPRRLVVSWVGQDDWTVELDRRSENGRTVLRFRQVFAADADVADFAAGWHWYLDKFDAEVGGRPAPPGRGGFAPRGPGPGCGVGARPRPRPPRGGAGAAGAPAGGAGAGGGCPG